MCHLCSSYWIQQVWTCCVHTTATWCSIHVAPFKDALYYYSTQMYLSVVHLFVTILETLLVSCCVAFGVLYVLSLIVRQYSPPTEHSAGFFSSITTLVSFTLYTCLWNTYICMLTQQLYLYSYTCSYNPHPSWLPTAVHAVEFHSDVYDKYSPKVICTEFT